MLRSYKSTRKHAIGAVDGPIGTLHDMLFDDHLWVIRYLVADTGKWLPGRQVLIAPTAASEIDWAEGVVSVDLTRQEVEDSPPVEADEPVSRQKAEEVNQYFGWPAYWTPMAPNTSSGFVTATAARVPAADEEQGTEPRDPHLRSAREVTGYHVATLDGEMGHIEDFIVDDDNWNIRYAVVDTANWWPGKKVVLAPDWIVGISWDSRIVRFDLSKEAIQDAPEYDPTQPVNREYEVLLYDYYGQPRYWDDRVRDRANP